MSVQNAKDYLDWMYPNEQHSAGGTCPNPKCNYVLTAQDDDEIDQDHGWFTCPQCGMTFNLYDDYYNEQPGGHTRAIGLSTTQMGQIGEHVVLQLGQVPTLGKVVKYYGADIYNNPIDFQIGIFGVELKTIHSEVSNPRFKLTGGGAGRTRQESIQEATAFCERENLKPAMVGVRLNFYSNMADIFARQGFADTWIGSANMPHVATVNFKSLNPYKDPSEVPPPSELPDGDDVDSDIPF